MNNTYRTDFENMGIMTLENIHRGINHKVEELQEKLSGDMGITSKYTILPRNFEILPIDKCSLHDIKMLEDLHAKRFDCFWTMEQKKAKQNRTIELFEATFQFYSYLDIHNDNEINQLYNVCQAWNDGSIMSSHQIIRQIMRNPNFLYEVML